MNATPPISALPPAASIERREPVGALDRDRDVDDATASPPRRAAPPPAGTGRIVDVTV
jgi:hypothetical protein